MEVLVKSVMNQSIWLQVFLLGNGTIRAITNNEFAFDFTLESKIITMNSGNCCGSLSIIDAKMHAYEIKNRATRWDQDQGHQL